MLTAFRIAWRLNRIELTLLGAAALFVSVALAWLGWQASAIISSDPACFYHGNPGVVPSESPSCEALRIFLSEQMTWERTLNLGLAATAAPFVLGTLLGAPIVASEIEHGTAGMAWTLARSRAAWLAQRLLPIALFLVVALVLIGVAGSLVEDARFNTGFWRGYSPWWVLVARGLLVFGLGVLGGTLIGRVLPAVLLTAVACVVFLPIGTVMDRQLESEAVWVAQTDLVNSVGARSFGGGAYRNDATGEVISTSDYDNKPRGQAVMGADLAEGMTPVDLLVPASRYMEFTVREAGLTAGLALVTGGAAFALIRRRRPY
jgi:hypothetical protein